MNLVSVALRDFKNAWKTSPWYMTFMSVSLFMWIIGFPLIEYFQAHQHISFWVQWKRWMQQTSCTIPKVMAALFCIFVISQALKAWLRKIDKC